MDAIVASPFQNALSIGVSVRVVTSFCNWVLADSWSSVATSLPLSLIVSVLDEVASPCDVSES